MAARLWRPEHSQQDGKLHLDDPQVREAAIKALTYPTTAYKEGFGGSGGTEPLMDGLSISRTCVNSAGFALRRLFQSSYVISSSMPVLRIRGRTYCPRAPKALL